LFFQAFPHHRRLGGAARPAFLFQPSEQVLGQFERNRIHGNKVIRPDSSAIPDSILVSTTGKPCSGPKIAEKQALTLGEFLV
jgi:hypothetical protein